MPLASFVLVFDGLGSSRDPLFGGGAPGRGKRIGVRRKSFRINPIDGVGPTIVVANDFVNDVCHRLSARCSCCRYR